MQPNIRFIVNQNILENQIENINTIYSYTNLLENISDTSGLWAIHELFQFIEGLILF
jgi:hypothetical protein